MVRIRRFHPDFPKDLRDAAHHFDGISAILGQRFRQAVRETLEFITANPDLYARFAGEVRAAKLKKFPYVLLYVREAAHVDFIALVIGHSDRLNWFERVHESDKT